VAIGLQTDHNYI